MEKHKIYINHMLALCHMYKYYESFTNDLKEILSNYYYKGTDFACTLKRISTGERLFNTKREKKFYYKHQTAIDTINKYTSIQTFINLNYDKYGREEPDNSMDYFYKYILEHETELNKIITLLKKLKELGFNKFEFQDFAKNDYSILKVSYNNKITYLDNMQAIPSADNKELKYKSDFSNYKIIIDSQNNCEKTKIILNDMTFDSDRLPAHINRKDLTNKILDLENEILEENKGLQDAVKLSNSVTCLYFIYEYVYKQINELCTDDYKEKLLAILEEIKNKINELKLLSNLYNFELTNQYESISLEDIQKNIHELRRNKKKEN